MNYYNNRIWLLISRELTGEATPAEKNDLQEWLDEDLKHREIYKIIDSSWQEEPGASVDTPFFFDYESGLERLRNKLKREGSIPKKNKMPERRLTRIHAWAIAASVVLVLFSLSVYLTFHIWEEPESVTSYATSGVEQRIITLSDGSVVRLNRNSKIEVNNNWDEGVKMVRLEGEAFFDVAENPDRPFMIHADNAVVQVLGTSFNVKQGREVMVAVQEGLVSFRHKDHEEKSAVSLVEGQLGLLSEDGQNVIIEETNIENYMSWKNGYLRFDRMPFDQVIQQLEWIYGLNHELQDPSIGKVELTVYTERMQMEEVLESIGIALDLLYEKQGDTITWQREEALPREHVQQ